MGRSVRAVLEKCLVSWVAMGRHGLHPQSWALPLPGPFSQLYDKGPRLSPNQGQDYDQLLNTPIRSSTRL